MYGQKKKYLLFPKLYSKHLLFLYFFIISCLKKGAQIFFEKDQRLSIEFIKLYLYDFGDFLSIIPLLIMKKRMKNEQKDHNKINIENVLNDANIQSFHYNRNIKKSNWALYRNIFIFVYVDFIGQISSVIFYVIQNEQKLIVKQANLNSASIFNIISILLFSICLLHTKVYKHHIFSILINMICFIVLTAIDITRIYDSGENIIVSIMYLLVRIFSAILYSAENVIAKIIFLYYYLSTFGLLVWKAVIDFFNLIIFSFPFIFIKLQDKEGEQKIVFEMIADVFDDKIYILIFILYMLTNFFYTNMCLKIIDAFSPNHFVISRLLENLAVFIIDLIVNGPSSQEDLIIRIISFILLILAALIYNEFLVINICGLSKNTQLFLDYEAKYDFSFTQNINDDEDEDDKSAGVIEIKSYLIKNDDDLKDLD